MAVAVWKQNTIGGVGQKGDPGEMDYSIVAESEGTPDYKMIDGKLYKLVDSDYEETKIMNEVAQNSEDISTLNSSLTWKTIATNVTSLTHDFTQYQELLVDVSFSGGVNHATIHIITASLESSAKNYSNGFYRYASDASGVRVTIKNSGITGCAVYADGNTNPIASTFTVYAR